MSMTFEQFVSNVQQWSTERGIYAHSTALAQALKAVSEVGELADAVIKNDRDAIKDAIGDVVVCLVNVAYMRNTEISCGAVEPYATPAIAAAFAARAVANMTTDIICGDHLDVVWVISELAACTEECGFGFLDCCESAWNEIKDRKGRMVAGGAFVKDGA